MIANREAAEIALGLPLRATFHYAVPAAVAELVGRGAVVVVPFGRRFLTGYVLGLSPPPADAGGKLKPIQDVLEPAGTIGPDLFELAEFVADYYLCPLGEVLRAALPTLSVSTRRRARLTGVGAEALARASGALSGPDRLLLDALAARGELTDEAVARVTGVGGVRAQLRRLEVDGLVVVETRSSTPTRAKTARDIQLVPGFDGNHPELARSPVLRRIVELLAANAGSLPHARLRVAAKATPDHFRRLLAADLIRVVEREVARDLGPERTAATRRLSAMTLNAGQRHAADAVAAAAERGGFAPFLLHGITGSGKTLVYLDCIEATLRRGRSAIILVPEIALTPVLGRELRGRFGDDVALLHSGLGTGERYDAWRRVASGAARVVFGARSAVFAPARDLGLIVVDEEHDSSYKQDERPHYHGRDLAVARAKLLGVPIILGSATPSLESYRNAVDGRYQLLELAARAGGQSLPAVEIVDLRDEFERVGGTPIISQRLEDELAARVATGEQAVLLLNRRGYACFLLCRECGHKAECPNCSICLTYHRAERLLKCHHCEHRQRPTEACSECGGLFLNLVGHGTEKVETVIRERLPTARIARLDRDTVRGRHDVEEVLGRFERGEVDILIGTQMVAKGHDFPNVTLVGVVSVDAMLALPDFRATERAFSLLTQVAGRAGRGDRPGLVLLQTYHPENEAVRLACAQDYQSFYAREIRLRQLMRYPPMAHLANLILKGEDCDEVMREARSLARGLDEARPPAVRMLGPAMAPVQRIKRSYRSQILLKGQVRRPLRDLLRAADEGLRAKLKGATLDIDVDPQDLL